MHPNLEDLKEMASRLSVTERAALALALIRSLDEPSETDDDAGVEEAWATEIQRRSDQLERGEVEAVAGDEVMARARRLLR